MLTVKIKNLNKENDLLLSGVEKEPEQAFFGSTPKKDRIYRYVLRPGEEEEFKIQKTQLLGLEQL